VVSVAEVGEAVTTQDTAGSAAAEATEIPAQAAALQEVLGSTAIVAAGEAVAWEAQSSIIVVC
jgi:hypothetical protein